MSMYTWDMNGTFTEHTYYAIYKHTYIKTEFISSFGSTEPSILKKCNYAKRKVLRREILKSRSWLLFSCYNMSKRAV